MEEADYTEEIKNIKSYLRDLKYKALPPLEEEEELAERISAGDERARQQMINAYMRSIIMITKRGSGSEYTRYI